MPLRSLRSERASDAGRSEWGTTSFTCPQCGVVFKVGELEEAAPLACPSCGAGFTVEYKYDWLYLFACVLCASLIAYLQGFQSVVFWGAVLIYSAIGAASVNLLGFKLKLPKRFVLIAPHTQTLDIDQRNR